MDSNNTKPLEKTDNEIIAEFMRNDAINSPHLRTAKELEYTYDYSWDYLMPVVEKIEKLYSDNFPIDFLKKILAKEPNGTEPYINVIALPLSTPIGEAYKAVVKFIKWYNENKKP